MCTFITSYIIYIAAEKQELTFKNVVINGINEAFSQGAIHILV